VAEVTYDPVDILKQFAARETIGYTLLSDPKSSIIGAFGLIDGSVPADSKWYGFAHPMIFVIDSKGVVRHRFSETNYQNRPDVEVILDILRKEAKG
jgi:peroxiredoxin